MVGSPLKIGIDIDGTITHAPAFFKTFCERMKDVAEIHIVTARSQRGEKDYLPVLDASEAELEELGIYYDMLSCVGHKNKGKYIEEQGISVMFDDMDEEIVCIPSSCVVFKVREDFNYCWETNRWLHSDETSVNVNASTVERFVPHALLKQILRERRNNSSSLNDAVPSLKSDK